MLVFVVSGLWHGANWTFILWGALHGFYLLFEIITKKIRRYITYILRLNYYPKIRKLIQIIITFILVNIGWVLFRANNIKDALYILTHLFKGLSFNFTGINIGMLWIELFIALGVIGIMELVHLIQEYKSIGSILDRNLVLRWIMYIVILLLIILFGVFKKIPFIYFQF